jgi:hypothetical protein
VTPVVPCVELDVPCVVPLVVPDVLPVESVPVDEPVVAVVPPEVSLLIPPGVEPVLRDRWSLSSQPTATARRAAARTVIVVRMNVLLLNLEIHRHRELRGIRPAEPGGGGVRGAVFHG